MEEIINLHPSTKRRILEHLWEIEYVMLQIRVLLERAEEREKTKRTLKKVEQKIHKD